MVCIVQFIQQMYFAIFCLAIFVASATGQGLGSVAQSCGQISNTAAQRSCIQQQASNCASCSNCCNTGCSNSNNCQQACSSCQTASTGCCNGNTIRDESCIAECLRKCFGENCDVNCYRICNPQPTKIPRPPSEPYLTRNETTITEIQNNNTIPVNVTTVIRLTNQIINVNKISVPINVTNYNHNHMVSMSNSTNSVISNQNQTHSPQMVNGTTKCCFILYPVHCHEVYGPPFIKCIQKRVWDCSEMCTSVVVQVIHVPKPYIVQTPPVPYPVPYPVPQPQVRPFSRCHYANQYPWIQCNQYQAANCGSCYYCGGQYNVGQCSKQSSCSNLCQVAPINNPNIVQLLNQYGPTY